MTTETEIPVEQRILEALQHLGVSRAHFAGRAAQDWSRLAEFHPEVISSLTLLFPQGFDPEVLASVAPRLLVFSGDRGESAELLKRNSEKLAEACIVRLPGYPSPNTYADVALDRAEDIGSGLLEFLEGLNGVQNAPAATISQKEGEVAGISYRIRGSGPSLVLLPLGAAPSQWEPVAPRLSQSFTTIVLGGPELGMVASLEGRGRTSGYLGGVRSLLEEAQLEPGETVLEVGCGTGVLDRWLAQRTGGENQIVGVDVNPFFLREAEALVKRHGLDSVVGFKEGSAEDLPFSDNSFDLAFSSTVIQRVNADLLLKEMVRVTKPGGRIAVLGHAHDMPRWVNLPLRAELHPEVISSLTILFPQGFDPEVLASVAPRLLVFSGDRGESAELLKRNSEKLAEACIVRLPGYPSPNTYADVALDRAEDIGSGLLEFLEGLNGVQNAPAATISQKEGEVAGISYRIRGSGPSLVLLPLGAAPSQWEPVAPRLSQSFTTIVLGGPELGMVASLEGRGRTSGYLGGVRSLLEEAQLEPGETVLEVGCGTGVLDRWLAQRTGGENQIVGVDVNPFFLREAEALVKRHGLDSVVGFKEGSAEDLPFSDNSFDLAFSSTVIQRVNADLLLKEMVRVTKPGGRVAVLGHAHDMPRWINLPLRDELKLKIESPPWVTDRGHEKGCDDASLYQRFNQIGLSQIKMFPYMSTFTGWPRLQMLQTDILPKLNAEEAEEWRAAVAQAQADGTFFTATPFHCAIGTKPSNA